MSQEIIAEQVKLQPPDARKRVRELIDQRGILTLSELFEAGHSEGWNFGPGVDVLDFVLSGVELGKVELMQSFPIHRQDNRIFIVSCSLLDRRESPTPK